MGWGLEGWPTRVALIGHGSRPISGSLGSFQSTGQPQASSFALSLGEANSCVALVANRSLRRPRDRSCSHSYRRGKGRHCTRAISSSETVLSGLGDMSAPNDEDDVGPVWEEGPDSESEEQAMPLSSEAEEEFPDLEGFESFEVEEDEEETEAGWPVLCGREGRPCSPADDIEGPTLEYLGNRAAMAILQQLVDRGDLGVRRNASSESSDSEGSTFWDDPQPGPSGRGVGAQGWVASWLACNDPAQLRGPEGGWDWGSSSMSAKDRSRVAVGCQRPWAEGLVDSSNSESSDDLGEIQLMESICHKGGGQATASSSEDTARPSIPQGREKLLPVSTLLLYPDRRRPFTSMAKGQAVEELEVPLKRQKSGAWSKVGSRPSHRPEAAAAAAAAAGRMPKATPHRKVAQEKICQGGSSKAAPGSTFASWDQRVSAAPVGPASFQPIPAVQLLGRSKRYSLLCLETKQSQHTGTGQKSAVRGKRRFESIVGEDKDPRRGTVPPGQPPIHRSRTSYPCMLHGGDNSGDAKNGATPDAEHSQPLDLHQEEVLLRGSGPSGDQEQPGRPPTLERQQPSGTEGRPPCPELHRKGYDLRQQLAMLSLTDKFKKT